MTLFKNLKSLLFAGLILMSSLSLAEEKTAVIVLQDATESLDRIANENAVSIREDLANVLRIILKASTSQKTEVEVNLLRICGRVELLWQSPVTKKDYPEVTQIITEGFKSCEVSDIEGENPSEGRATGTNLTEAFQTIEALIKVYGPETSIHVIMATDGIAQNADGEITLSEASSTLQAIAINLEGYQINRFLMLGLDESVRLDWLLSMNKAFPQGKTYGMLDLKDGLNKLIADLN